MMLRYLAGLVLFIVILQSTKAASIQTRNPSAESKTFIHRVKRSSSNQYIRSKKAEIEELHTTEALLKKISKWSAHQKNVINQCIRRYLKKHSTKDVIQAFRHCIS